MRRLADRPESQCLAHVASIYFEAKNRTGDHQQAFVETVRRALQENYQPVACWVTTSMLATGRPTHAVALSHADSVAIYLVTVGGVSVNWMAALEDEIFNLERGCGWKLIEGEALDQYLAWSRREIKVTRQQREAAVRYARATSALEGIRESAETTELAQRFADGEVTIEEAIEETRSRYFSDPEQ